MTMIPLPVKKDTEISSSPVVDKEHESEDNDMQRVLKPNTSNPEKAPIMMTSGGHEGGAEDKERLITTNTDRLTSVDTANEGSTLLHQHCMATKASTKGVPVSYVNTLPTTSWQIQNHGQILPLATPQTSTSTSTSSTAADNCRTPSGYQTYPSVTPSSSSYSFNISSSKSSSYPLPVPPPSVANYPSSLGYATANNNISNVYPADSTNILPPPCLSPNQSHLQQKLHQQQQQQQQQIIKQLQLKQSQQSFQRFKQRRAPTAQQITEAIPSNASSIFYVFDRRIDFDSHLRHRSGDNNDEDDDDVVDVREEENRASMYALLRAWVYDDPYRCVPPPGSNLMDYVAVPSMRRRRKRKRTTNVWVGGETGEKLEKSTVKRNSMANACGDNDDEMRNNSSEGKEEGICDILSQLQPPCPPNKGNAASAENVTTTPDSHSCIVSNNNYPKQLKSASPPWNTTKTSDILALHVKNAKRWRKKALQQREKRLHHNRCRERLEALGIRLWNDL